MNKYAPWQGWFMYCLHRVVHRGQVPAEANPWEQGFGVSPEGIGTLGMALNFVVAIVIAR